MALFQKKPKQEERPARKTGRIAFQGGTYSLIITAVVLAILIVVNIFASVLPSSLTKLDISSTNLYSITSNTKVVVNGLEKDVTIYWIVQNDEEDSVIENLLAKYSDLSSHITVEKKNPDTYPTFASQYTDETVENNSLVVECGDKSRYISYSDIYQTDVDYTTYSYVYSFDGEGAITSAIDYVVSDELPVVYLLEGHGEAELPTDFQDQIEKENMELSSLSLLTEDEIPEDADCILIYAPSSDISEEEETMLANYAAEGGKLMVIAGPAEDDALTNLYKLLEDYGVTSTDDIVVEGDRDHYAFQQPYILLPDMQSSTVTDALIEEKYNVIMPIARGLQVDEENAGNVTTLLTTSESAYGKTAGYDLETYEKEDGDLDGPFTLSVSVETDGGGQIFWVSSSSFLEEAYNAYSSGANLDFAMNGLSSLIGENEAIAIRSKSLGYNYLTISEDISTILKAVMIGIIPLAFVIAGIAITAGRKKKRHE